MYWRIIGCIVENLLKGIVMNIQPRSAGVGAIVFVFLAVLSAVIPGQEPETRPQPVGTSFLMAPSAHIPGEEYLGTGFGGNIAGMYRFSGAPLYADLGVGYTSTASTGIDTNATVATVGAAAGAGVYYPLFPWLRVRAGGRVGWANASMDGDDGTEAMGGLYWAGIAGVEVPLFGGFSLVAEGGVSAHLITYLAYNVGVGIAWSPSEFTPRERPPRERPQQARPEPLIAEEERPDEDADRTPEPTLALMQTVEYTRGDLHLKDAGFGTVFPVFYRYYNNHPVGTATLYNDGRRDIENVEVTINIPRFMDLPQTQQTIATLESDEAAEIDLNVLFNDTLLGVTEGTTVAAQIIVDYEVRGNPESYSVNTTLNVANRNAMTWDDDRKAASFVTAKDPAVLSFAKNVAGIVRTAGRSAVNANLRSAMAILEALNLHGLQYVIDPTTPYAELSENAQAIDFLQFPVQTMEYRAGDCDDLSICYASNLEAVGVPAAFVTIPGHIFTAFNTGVPEERVSRVFPRPDEVIIHEGEAWIPVETTIMDAGFVEAWKIGARQWREHDARGQAELIPIQTAWQAFEPIGFDLEQRGRIEVPGQADLLRAYTDELDDYVAAAIEPKVARIQRRIEARGPSASQYNRIGVLYAKYEMIDQAQEWLTKAIQTEPYADAYLNVGHLSYMQEQYIDALDNYERAEEIDPDDDAVVLAISRVHHELENYGYATRYYERLETLNPDMADRFDYLQFRGSDVGRASDAALMKSVIVWGEDDK